LQHFFPFHGIAFMYLVDGFNLIVLHQHIPYHSYIQTGSESPAWDLGSLFNPAAAVAHSSADWIHENYKKLSKYQYF
jgi:hypothetical protein